MLLDKLLSNLDVRVDQFLVCEVLPGQRVHVPGSPQIMIHFILRGGGFLRSPEGTSHPLEPCFLGVVNKGAPHALESTGEIVQECDVKVAIEAASERSARKKKSPAMIVACGLVEVSYGSALGVFDQLDDMLVEDLSDVPRVQSAFNDILSEHLNGAPGSDAMKVALMSQCIVYLFRHLCADGTCSLPWLAGLEDEGLARVLDVILRDPGNLHTVESLAETASMSRSSFAEAFVSAFGQPPMSMVRRVRLERAWKLLEQDGGMPIEMIAHRVGFSSRSHFSRAFKQHFGVSPLAIRDMQSQ